MTGALMRYRVMAWVTGVFLLIMTAWLVVTGGYGLLGYGEPGDKPLLYVLAWTVHGWLYIIYLIAAVDLTFRMRWSLLTTLLILLAGTIPFASFFADNWVTKKVHAQLATLVNPSAATASPADQVKPTA